MNLYLRLLFALWSGVRAKKLTHEDSCSKGFRVWPHDLDAFGHMNNGRYLQIMDVARAEWMVRTGVFQSMRSHGWSALLGGGMTRFRRHLRLWQRYQVHTRLLCWDQRWFYFEHKFADTNGRIAAVGFSQAALRNQQGWIDTNVVAHSIAPGASSPEQPRYLARWLDADAAMFWHAENTSTQSSASALEASS